MHIRHLYLITSNVGLQGFFGKKTVLKAQMDNPVAGKDPPLQSGMPAASGIFDLLPQLLFLIPHLHQQGVMRLQILFGGRIFGLVHDDLCRFDPFPGHLVIPVPYRHQPVSVKFHQFFVSRSPGRSVNRVFIFLTCQTIDTLSR